MSRPIVRIFSLVLCFTLLFQHSGFAQAAFELNLASHLQGTRAPVVEAYRPLHLRSLGFTPSSQEFNLLLDKGSAPPSDLATETEKLMEFFLVGVSLPNASFWVNLRPDSPDEVIDPYVEQTEVGRILLEADVRLKKDTALATSPATPEGKEYWKRLYQKAGELFGSTESIQIPTLVRPWILPDEIIIREAAGEAGSTERAKRVEGPSADGSTPLTIGTERNQSAYIYKATLKVMLEEDYLQGAGNGVQGTVGYNFKDPRLKALNEYAAQLMRELVIPGLSRKVNTAKEYAPLRQVYYSLILAQWFKSRFVGKGGVYSSRIDSSDLTGLASLTPWSKKSYFTQYQDSFSKGEYQIKEQVATSLGSSMRTYVSGGIMLTMGEDSFPAATRGKFTGSSSSPIRVLGGNPERQVRTPQLIEAHTVRGKVEVKEAAQAGSSVALTYDTEFTHGGSRFKIIGNEGAGHWAVAERVIEDGRETWKNNGLMLPGEDIRKELSAQVVKEKEPASSPLGESSKEAFLGRSRLTPERPYRFVYRFPITIVVSGRELRIYSRYDLPEGWKAFGLDPGVDFFLVDPYIAPNRSLLGILPLPAGTTSVGRADRKTQQRFTFEDEVSREHLEIATGTDTVTITDRNSSNGTEMLEDAAYISPARLARLLQVSPGSFSEETTTLVLRHIIHPRGLEEEKGRIDPTRLDALIIAMRAQRQSLPQLGLIRRLLAQVSSRFAEQSVFSHTLAFLELARFLRQKENIELVTYVHPSRFRAIGELVRWFPSELIKRIRVPVTLQLEALPRDRAGDAAQMTVGPIRVDPVKNGNRIALAETIWHEFLHKASFSSDRSGRPILTVAQWKEIAKAAGFYGAIIGGRLVTIDNINVDYKEFRSIGFGEWVFQESDGLRCYVLDTRQLALAQNPVFIRNNIKVALYRSGEYWKTTPLEAVAEIGTQYIRDSASITGELGNEGRVARILRDTLFVVTAKGSRMRYEFNFNKGKKELVRVSRIAAPSSPVTLTRREFLGAAAVAAAGNALNAASARDRITPQFNTVDDALRTNWNKTSTGIYHIGESDPARPILLFIHGVDGSPNDFERLLRRFSGRYNIIVFAYDYLRALENSAVLTEAFRRSIGSGGSDRLFIIAHSFGNNVFIKAVLDLAEADRDTFQHATVIQLAPTSFGSAKAAGASGFLKQAMAGLYAILPRVPDYRRIAAAQDPGGSAIRNITGNYATFLERVGPVHTMVISNDKHMPRGSALYATLTKNAERLTALEAMTGDGHTEILSREEVLGSVASIIASGEDAASFGASSPVANTIILFGEAQDSLEWSTIPSPASRSLLVLNRSDLEGPAAMAQRLSLDGGITVRLSGPPVQTLPISRDMQDFLRDTLKAQLPQADTFNPDVPEVYASWVSTFLEKLNPAVATGILPGLQGGASSPVQDPKQFGVGGNPLRAMKEKLAGGEKNISALLTAAPDYTPILTPAGSEGIVGGSVDGTGHRNYRDATGKQWMFKAFPSQRLHRALVDEVVYRVAVRIGLTDSMKVVVGRVGSSFGTFVEWFDNQGSLWQEVGQYGRSVPQYLSKDVLKRIVREHILDWLVSQHDSHGGSFLKVGSGVRATDKSQAFKYMGYTDYRKERLALDYNPNADINGAGNVHYFPIYNIVLDAVRKGACPLSLAEAWQEVQLVLAEAEKLTSDEYIEMLRPYAIFRFDVMHSSEEKLKSSGEFLQLARARKEGLRRDFVQLYRTPGLAIPDATATSLAPVTPPGAPLASDVAIAQKIQAHTIKIVLLDLDGTLADGMLSPEMAQRIFRLDQAGIRVVVLSEETPSGINYRVVQRIQQLGFTLQHPILVRGYGGARPMTSAEKKRIAEGSYKALGNRLQSVGDAGYQLRVRLRAGVNREEAAGSLLSYFEAQGGAAPYIFYAESDPQTLKVFTRHKPEEAEDLLAELGVDASETLVMVDSAGNRHMSDWYLAMRFAQRGALVVNLGPAGTGVLAQSPNVIQLADTHVAGASNILQKIDALKNPPGAKGSSPVTQHPLVGRSYTRGEFFDLMGQAERQGARLLLDSPDPDTDSPLLRTWADRIDVFLAAPAGTPATTVISQLSHLREGLHSLRDLLLMERLSTFDIGGVAYAFRIMLAEGAELRDREGRTVTGFAIRDQGSHMILLYATDLGSFIRVVLEELVFAEGTDLREVVERGEEGDRLVMEHVSLPEDLRFLRAYCLQAVAGGLIRETTLSIPGGAGAQAIQPVIPAETVRAIDALAPSALRDFIDLRDEIDMRIQSAYPVVADMGENEPMRRERDYLLALSAAITDYARGRLNASGFSQDTPAVSSPLPLNEEEQGMITSLQISPDLKLRISDALTAMQDFNDRYNLLSAVSGALATLKEMSRDDEAAEAIIGGMWGHREIAFIPDTIGFQGSQMPEYRFFAAMLRELSAVFATRTARLTPGILRSLFALSTFDAFLYTKALDRCGSPYYDAQGTFAAHLTEAIVTGDDVSSELLSNEIATFLVTSQRAAGENVSSDNEQRFRDAFRLRKALEALREQFVAESFTPDTVIADYRVNGERVIGVGSDQAQAFMRDRRVEVIPPTSRPVRTRYTTDELLAFARERHLDPDGSTMRIVISESGKLYASKRKEKERYATPEAAAQKEREAWRFVGSKAAVIDGTGRHVVTEFLIEYRNASELHSLGLTPQQYAKAKEAVALRQQELEPIMEDRREENFLVRIEEGLIDVSPIDPLSTTAVDQTGQGSSPVQGDDETVSLIAGEIDRFLVENEGVTPEELLLLKQASVHAAFPKELVPFYEQQREERSKGYPGKDVSWFLLGDPGRLQGFRNILRNVRELVQADLARLLGEQAASDTRAYWEVYGLEPSAAPRTPERPGAILPPLTALAALTVEQRVRILDSMATGRRWAYEAPYWIGPEGVKIEVVPTRRRPSSSSPVQQSESDKGGIDFRQLPIAGDAAGGALGLSGRPVTSASHLNAGESWGQIERMVSAGIVPSVERIREHVAACYAAKDKESEIGRALSCIAGILRLEEERCVTTDKEMAELLATLETV